jgi:uncharacterized protein YdaU (DUF1376 family)
MPLYCGDYEADTAHLTIEEDGAYMRLLRLCWRSPGCCVPNDPAWIMRKMRVDAETYERTVAPIIDEFFKVEKAKVYSPRLSAEHARISDTFEKRSAAGKKGGRPVKPLKANDSDESRDKAKRKQPEPEPEPEPDKERDLTLSGSGLSDPQIPDPITPPPKPKASKPDGPPKARMPDGWRPMPDQIESALAEGIPEDRMEDEIYDFIEYWQGVKAAHGRKSDRGWGVAWRNNVARVVGMRYRGNPGGNGVGGVAGGQVSGRGGPASRAAAAGVRYLNRHHGGQ